MRPGAGLGPQHRGEERGGGGNHIGNRPTKVPGAENSSGDLPRDRVRQDVWLVPPGGLGWWVLGSQHSAVPPKM